MPALHPCLQKYRKCDYGDSCKFAHYPRAACLECLKGRLCSECGEGEGCIIAAKAKGKSAPKEVGDFLDLSGLSRT